MTIQLNPDLPASYGVPGVYVFQSRAGGTPAAANNRVLLLGYKTAAGTAPAGSPQRALVEDDVVQLCGKGSDLHRMWRSFVAQTESSGAEIWVMPMSAPAGAAQTRTIKIMQAPSGGALGTGNTGALAAGFVSVWIAGVRFDAQIANGDTYASIASNLTAQIQANPDFLPCTASVVGDTITLTARLAALTSADLPLMVKFSNAAMALAASPGTLTAATTATGAGSAIVGVATQSVSAAITSGDAATAIAASLVTGINSANAFPVTAARTAPSATVTLFYVADRVFNWAFSAITTGIGTTLTPAWGADASGLPSAASPSLATVLDTVSSQPAFKLLVTNFTGAGSTIPLAGFTLSGSASDYSVLGAISSVVEQIGNGVNCKGTIVVFCDTRSLTRVGSIPVGTTPALTASPRYFPAICVGSPQQAYESAARLAAIIIQHLDYPPFNYMGQVLQTDSRTPYLLPHAAVALTNAEINAAMLSYYLTPLVANSSNQMSIVSGRTSAKPSAAMAAEYSFWGTILADDYVRDDLRATISTAGKSLKNHSPSRTQFTTNADAILTGVKARVIFYDSVDIIDGADSLNPGSAAQVNVVSPARVDVTLLKRFPIPAEQVSIVTAMAS